MKKENRFYIIVWALAVAVFNAVIFAIPNDVFGVTRFDKPVFWISYVFVMLSFAGQLVVFFIFSKKDTAEKKFLGLSLLRSSYISVIVCIIVGSVFMTVAVMPAWIGAIVCVLTLAFQIFAAVKISAAATYVEQVGEKVKNQRRFIAELTADASVLSGRAKSAETKVLVTKVYEAIRYSDPMSSEALFDEDKKIRLQYDELKKAVAEDSSECGVIADELLTLIKERNAKCKLLK